jgi:trans-aconitate methyltransferase
VSFAVTADAYDQFMGRFSAPLAEQFVALLSLDDGACALDVGCGPGALTRVLVDRLGAGQVAAVDPAPPFVAAVRVGRRTALRGRHLRRRGGPARRALHARPRGRLA